MVGFTTLIGLTIADYVDDHAVHREYIAAIFGIVCTFGGYGVDRIVGRWLGR